MGHFNGKLAMRMRRVTWPGGWGHPKTHFESAPRFTYSLYNVWVYMEHPPL